MARETPPPLWQMPFQISIFFGTLPLSWVMVEQKERKRHLIVIKSQWVVYTCTVCFWEKKKQRIASECFIQPFYFYLSLRLFFVIFDNKVFKSEKFTDWEWKKMSGLTFKLFLLSILFVGNYCLALSPDRIVGGSDAFLGKWAFVK